MPLSNFLNDDGTAERLNVHFFLKDEKNFLFSLFRASAKKVEFARDLDFLTTLWPFCVAVAAVVLQKPVKRVSSSHGLGSSRHAPIQQRKG